MEIVEKKRKRRPEETNDQYVMAHIGAILDKTFPVPETDDGLLEEAERRQKTKRSTN